MLKYGNMETWKTLKHGNRGEKYSIWKPPIIRHPGRALSFQLRLRLQDLQVTKGDAGPDPEGIPRAPGVVPIDTNLHNAFQALNNEQQQEIVIKERNTGKRITFDKYFPQPVEGEKTQYNLRNFWLFNPKSEELLISLLCPKVSC